jgi:L-threonylcarbamoyladenylate synthase
MTTLIAIDPRSPGPDKIAEAVSILKGGGVIAYPTETFYGLGADARNEKAIEKIFVMKGRAFKNPVSVIIATQWDILPLVSEVPETAKILMKTFWPGPLTLVFTASNRVSHLLTAGSGKIGIRVSSHPIAALLVHSLGAPLTATSANRSGESENASASGVVKSLSDLPDAIIDGDETPGQPGSTILDVTVFPPLILREGAISGKKIHSAIERVPF